MFVVFIDCFALIFVNFVRFSGIPHVVCVAFCGRDASLFLVFAPSATLNLSNFC